MRARLVLGSFVASAALAVTASSVLFAGMSPEEQARRRATVAHVGPTLVSAGELEDRLATVPRFQLRAFGDTADAIRRKFFDQIILPEVLYALASRDLHLESQLPASNKILRAESGAAVKAAMKGLRPAASIGMTEVRAYYDANKAKYDTPLRLYVFRILAATKAEALEILAEAKKEGTLDGFNKLARERSIDKATAMRGGNLGYLTPDGVSSEAGLSVDPAIVAAAMRVKDGEFVAEPVLERFGDKNGGDKNGGTAGYAVIWRRGSVPANRRTPEDAAAQIRETIWKGEADAMAKQHLEELRKAHLTELNESLLNGIEITPNEGDVVTRRRPGEVAPLTQSGRNAPHPTN